MNKFNLLITTFFLIIIGNVNAAINFTDFSRAPILDSPWKSASDGFDEGYRMAQEAERMQAEQRQLELQNKLLEEQLKMMKQE
ncbi:hypothetical protein Lste_2041 [Legionella steelei]|uniref:Secreted protein n=1 Tax=Legionella steelei TaxID=947033 RepID=A0A0W0ZJE8_9GAMM|nr:hypothetical protein [Legionella steelei]KTD68883.1 hypothetical protein Lste_2041 [Legionella steelei]